MPALMIGSRWRPGAVERRDTDVGTYESMNSQALTQTELYVQRALLAPIREPASLARIEAARSAGRVTQGTSQ